MKVAASSPAVSEARPVSGSQVRWPSLSVVLLFVVTALIIGPLAVLLRTSLAPAGTLPFDTWQVTTQNLVEVLSSPDTLRVVINTVLYAIGSVALGVLIATFVAWLTERTDMPGQTAIRVFLFAWMTVPPLAVGYGWILLINPGNGALNVYARAIFDTSQPLFTIYSFSSLILISALSIVPTAFVMIGGMFRNMDPNLEASARIGGASAWSVARYITLPLMLPSILSVAIFMIMLVVQAFDIPFIIGVTARIPVLSTRIYLLSSPDTGTPNYGLSASFGMLLLVVALLMIWGYFRAVGSGERYRVVTGKAFRRKRVELGLLRWPMLACVMVIIGIMLLPLLILLWASFFPFYRVPDLNSFGAATLDIYRKVLSLGVVRAAILNTLVVLFVSSTIVTFLATLVAWLSTSTDQRVARWTDVMSFTTTAVPPVVMAVAILLLYIRTPLYGTIGILILGYVTIYLAFSVRTMSGALMQLHKELQDAAWVSGASRWVVARRVVFPLVWPHFLNAWLWVAAHCARDLTLPLFLVTTGNVMFVTGIWELWGIPDLPGAAALSVLLVVSLLVIVVPIQMFISKRGDH